MSEFNTTFHGWKAVDNTLIDLQEQVFQCLKRPGSLLPQRYLYGTILGANTFADVCRNGHISSVYRDFPLGLWQHPLTQAFERVVASTGWFQSANESLDRLVVIALGSGLAERESRIVRWLSERYNVKKIDVYLNDISSELLKQGRANFERHRGSVSVQFFEADFESDAMKVRHFRDEVAGNDPVLFLYIGNTFGNVNHSIFLGQIRKMMHENDLLLCEFLAISQQQFDSISHESPRQKQEFVDASYDPLEDIRAPFVVSPLTSIGVHAPLQQLQRRRILDPSRGLIDVYFFHPDLDQIASLFQEVDNNRKNGITAPSIDLLSISALLSSYVREVFSSIFSFVEMLEVPYTYDSKEILMGYCFAHSMHQGLSITREGPLSVDILEPAPYQLDLISRTLSIGGKQPVKLSYIMSAYLWNMLINMNQQPHVFDFMAEYFSFLKEWRDADQGFQKDARTMKSLDTFSNCIEMNDPGYINKLKNEIKKKLFSLGIQEFIPLAKLIEKTRSYPPIVGLTPKDVKLIKWDGTEGMIKE